MSQFAFHRSTTRALIAGVALTAIFLAAAGGPALAKNVSVGGKGISPVGAKAYSGKSPKDPGKPQEGIHIKTGPNQSLGVGLNYPKNTVGLWSSNNGKTTGVGVSKSSSQGGLGSL